MQRYTPVHILIDDGQANSMNQAAHGQQASSDMRNQLACIIDLGQTHKNKRDFNIFREIL